MQVNLPYLSVITVTLNADAILEETLQSLKEQTYPKDKIEHLIVDGGSSDNTEELAQKYGCEFFNGGYRDNQEARRGVGIRKAKNEIIVFIDADNILQHEDWLMQMVQPFLENEEIFAVQPMYYHYKEDDSLYNRYCALFGVNDPVALYLNKADRLKNYEKKWYQTDVVEDKENYLVIKLSGEKFPTVGCNGFLIKREVLLKARHEGEDFFHIDVIYDLLEKGHDRIAIVKDSIWHKTGGSFKGLLKKRLSYFNMHSQKLGERRRYKLFDPKNKKDVFNLLKFCLYSVTFVKPLYDSIKGFVHKRDFAWFIHPYACFLFFLAYTTVTLKSAVSIRN
ncbi:glycosyltransferase [Patescibacteria group bacterium]